MVRKVTFVFALNFILMAGLLSAEQELRIVSHLPSLTEICYALGLGENVVGVSDFSSFPPDVINKPKIGGLINSNYEAVLALRPTLVLLGMGMKEHEAKYKQLGIRTLFTKNHSIKDIYNTISEIGKATNREQKALQLLDNLKAGLASIEKQYANRQKIRTLLVVGHAPGDLGALFIASKESYYDELLNVVGGVNCFGKEFSAYPNISKEVIIQKNPECILVFNPAGDDSLENLKKERAIWQKLGKIDAVKNGNLFLLTDDCFSKPGPRMLKAARLMAEALKKCHNK